MTDSVLEGLDEIDREIIRILSQTPRAPYTELSDKLEERGHDMSGEGIRYRVSTLLEATSTFFLLAPAEHGWQIVRACIEVSNEPGATGEVYDQVSNTDAWLVCQGFGSFDVWAIGTTRHNRGIQELLTELREIQHVENVYYFVETRRNTFMEDYLSFE